MKGRLSGGQKFRSMGNNEYEVVNILGAGSQGEVYEVICSNRSFALKWYYKHTATKRQKEILIKLIENGSPDESFLWPMDFINGNDNGFGYVMPLRPDNYKSIVDLMKRKAEPGFMELTRAAYNLTLGYNRLHKAGYQYRDISFGNVFIDPKTGNVLICDNDNVIPNGDGGSSVYGTPRFMAPEIVRGEAKPSRNTDLYSLAVLLFYMFMLNHPLEGKREAEIRCMDIHAMNRLYGKEPLFIFDEEDDSNRPLDGYQDNAKIYWDLYPDELKGLFMKSFTAGLNSPLRRVTENQWLNCFSDMIAGIMTCPVCGAELFYDKEKSDRKEVHICWGCSSIVKEPVMLEIGKRRIMMTSRTKLYPHYLYKDYDMRTVIGEVVVNPSNPKKWGIRNLSDKTWKYVKNDGSILDVENKRAAAIAANACIDFGEVTGKFISSKKTYASIGGE